MKAIILEQIVVPRLSKLKIDGLICKHRLGARTLTVFHMFIPTIFPLSAMFNSNFFQNCMIDVVESYDEQCETDVISQSP